MSAFALPAGARRLLKRWVYNPIYRLRLKEPDFPPEVWIENTNRCNARCVMCPRDKHTRAQGIMTMDLYRKLIDEISVHRSAVRRVHLHNYGEPLLDDKLAERVRIAKAAGIAHVYFVTNASLLTAQRADELIASGLDEFKISFYGTDRLRYNQTMAGLDFDVTIAQVKEFFRLRKMTRSPTPRVVIQYLPQEANEARSEEFVALFSGMIDRELGDRINIFSLHNFGAGRQYHRPGSQVCTICDYPWRTTVILWDGRVVPCCLDFNGELALGDVNRNTIAEVWNAKAYRGLRRDFKRLSYRGYPLCAACERSR